MAMPMVVVDTNLCRGNIYLPFDKPTHLPTHPTSRGNHLLGLHTRQRTLAIGGGIAPWLTSCLTGLDLTS